MRNTRRQGRNIGLRKRLRRCNLTGGDLLFLEASCKSGMVKPSFRKVPMIRMFSPQWNSDVCGKGIPK